MIPIAFYGYARAGKSTCSSYVETLSTRHRRLSFATPLKIMLEQIIGFDIWDDEKKSLPHEDLGGMTPRQAMQLLGTDFFRCQIWEDIWVNNMRKRLSEQAIAGKEFVIIDDARFPNEFDLIQEFNGLLVRVDRYGVEKMDHASEAFVDSIIPDWIIENEGTKEELYQKLDVLLKEEAIVS